MACTPTPTPPKKNRGSYADEEAERLQELENSMDNTKETVSPKHNRTDAHLNAQRLWPHAQGLYRFKVDTVSAPRGRSGHDLPSLTKKIPPVDNYLQRKT